MIIKAVFQNGSTKTFTRTLNQYDRGVKLIFEGIVLPENYEIHFSNTEYGGVGYASKGTIEGADIPDAYLQTGEYVYAWVYGLDAEQGGMTLYSVTIPVNKRPAPIKAAESSDKDYTAYSVEGENLILQTNFSKLIKDTEELNHG